jgi:hypothetical protein
MRQYRKIKKNADNVQIEDFDMVDLDAPTSDVQVNLDSKVAVSMSIIDNQVSPLIDSQRSVSASRRERQRLVKERNSLRQENVR